MTGVLINSIYTATQVIILFWYYELRISTIRNQDTYIYIYIYNRVNHLHVSRCWHYEENEKTPMALRDIYVLVRIYTYTLLTVKELSF